MNTYAVLTQIVNDREITPERDALFFYALQKSLLLALKEGNLLTETQLWHAVEKLKAQYHSRIRI